MTQLFPSQLTERKQVHDAEMAELSKYVPKLNSDVKIVTSLMLNACAGEKNTDTGEVGLRSSFPTNKSTLE